MHLVASKHPVLRQEVINRRISHFTEALPRVDHIAFVTSDMDTIKKRLDKERVFYRKFALPDESIQQIFILDPDGNVIEVSNCGPKPGEIRCDNTSTISEDSFVFDSM